MSFRSEHIKNDFMNRKYETRQAKTQYARVDIRRINKAYSVAYIGEDGVIKTNSKYSSFNSYNNKFKKGSYYAWQVYHYDKLPNSNVLKDKTYTYTITDDDSQKTTKLDTASSGKDKSSDKSTSSKKKEKDTLTTTTKGTTITITQDVDYNGKPKTERQTIVKKTKDLKYGVIEFEYNAPETQEYNIEILYGGCNDCILDNKIYVDNVAISTGNEWTAYREIMNRHINRVRLTKGKHTITLKLDSQTIIYAVGVKKYELFKADTNNDEELTLLSFNFEKTEEFEPIEATVVLMNYNLFKNKGKPYFPEYNRSNLLFDYRDEINIFVEDTSNNKKQVFGGYISSLELNEDDTELTLHCADRLIDLNNKYTLSELNYRGGDDDSTKSKEYTLSKQRYFIYYGDIVDFLTKTVEVPLKNNINQKTGAVVGEKNNNGFNYKWRNKDKKNYATEKKFAKNIDVATDSSNVKTRTNYMQLRNNYAKNQDQYITLFDYNNSKFKGTSIPINQFKINSFPYFYIEYAMGDPKSSYQVCNTTSNGDGQNYSSLTGNFKNRAKQLTDGVEGTTNKARKIYDYCCKVLSYESYSNCQHLPDDCIKRGKSNCCDSARTLTEMWRSVGITAGYCAGSVSFSDSGTVAHRWSYFVNEQGRKVECDCGRIIERWDIRRGNSSGYPTARFKNTVP